MTTGHSDRTIRDWDGMWQPGAWLNEASGSDKLSWRPVVAVVVLVTLANIVGNELLPPPLYVPFNLAIAGMAVWIARRDNTSWTALGLRRDRLWRGALIGLAIGAALLALLAMALTVPYTRDLLRDTRVTDGSITLAVYHVAFRVPIGTALYEELLFRGVLFGMFARRTNVATAAAASSLVFGLWHLLPVLDVLETNALGDVFVGGGGAFAAAAAGALATFGAGMALIWIRLLAKSLAAPIIVHIATNSGAILAATIVVHVL